MTKTLDLAVMTPAEVDAILADLDYERYVAFMKAVQYRQSAYKAQEGSRYSRPDPVRAEKLMGYASEQDQIAAAKKDEMAPYEAEFDRRGGWTRAFLVVTSGTGHVHSSQRCHTCYPTTQFHWVTKLSGHDEAEIVEAAGERACTICYPSAPAYVLNRPTALFTKDEEAKQAARAEREAKKAAALAASVIDPDTGKVLFKTERGATNDIASDLDTYLRYGDEKYLGWAKKTVEAVAAKRGVDPAGLLDELLDKATKKFRREAIKRAKGCLATKGQPGYHDVSDPALWHESIRKIAQEEGLI